MVYFKISPIGFDCGLDKNNCDKYQYDKQYKYGFIGKGNVNKSVG